MKNTIMVSVMALVSSLSAHADSIDDAGTKGLHFNPALFACVSDEVRPVMIGHLRLEHRTEDEIKAEMAELDRECAEAMAAERFKRTR